MGISSKWIKSLVGLRKHEKGQSSEKQEKSQNAESNETSFATRLLHKRKHSQDPEGTLAVEELAVQSERSTDYTNTQTISNSISSESILLEVHVSQTEEHASKEDLAAILIQSGFRAFLARRALRALKGIVILQALVRGRIVRKQTAETLQCMQALVKAEARVRARQVRVSLENQVARSNVPEQDHKNHVREIEEGWCGSIGSAEEMQTKVLKRLEAAAKRERAMAYALTHQRQAGSRQQKPTSLQGLEFDDNHWGSNWLERWMAVRPWENRLLDNNTKESMPMCDDKQDEETKSQMTPKTKVLVSSTSNGPNKKKGVKHKKSYSDVSCTSYGRSAIVLPSTSLGSSKQKLKQSDEVFDEVSSQPTNLASQSLGSSKQKLKQSDEVFDEVSSQPTNLASQSLRNSKERLAVNPSATKKRLSLPNNVGAGAGRGPANRNLIYQSVSARSELKPRASAPNQAKKQVESLA